MPSPVLTVIMPVYNAEKYVYEAIDSILKQTFTDFEFLIFNDCSTDASRDIIRSFRDARIRLVDSPVNIGYVQHLNEGLRQAKGKYIARMDADDVSRPDRFLMQVRYLEQYEEAGACGAWIEFIGAKQGVFEYVVDHKDIVTQLLLFGNAMAHPAVMIRKSVLDEHGFTYDASLEPAEDYDLWNRISSVRQLHNMPEVLLQYRVHDQNESVIKKAKQERAVQVIRKRLIGNVWQHNTDNTDAFLLNQAIMDLTDPELQAIRLNTLHLLHLNSYNNHKIRTELSNRFVACCKASKLSGFRKMVHYIRFPKHFFSVRICLSLLLYK